MSGAGGGGRALDDAMDYLTTGGLGEVIGLTSMALDLKQPKVQLDTDMAMCLCLLAAEALEKRAPPHPACGER